jgi:hypothetical protein
VTWQHVILWLGGARVNESESCRVSFRRAAHASTLLHARWDALLGELVRGQQPGHAHFTETQRVLDFAPMKGQLKVSTPAEYIARLDEPRRTDVASLDALIRKTAPKLEPFIHSGILAYGRWHYKYASGREGDWFRIGIASNENYISLYVSACTDKGYIAEGFKKALPKESIGKACMRFKRLSDLAALALKKLIREGAKLSVKPN